MRRYYYTFVFGALAILLVNGTFNWFVDGFAYFGRAPFGLYTDSYAREWAASRISKYPHDAVILGTSKTIQIPAKNINSCRVFNASFTGARPEELKYFIKHFLPSDKYLMIGLDLFTFNEEPLRQSKFGMISFKNLISYVFSLGATQYSLNVIKNWSKGRLGDSLLPEGGRATWRLVAGDNKMTDYNYEEYNKIISSAMFNNFKLSETRFEILRDIKRILERRDQRYVTFINPLSPFLIDFYKDIGVYDDLIEFRRIVHDIFPTTIDLSVGEYSVKENFYKLDSLHYLPHIGAKFIDEILEKRKCIKS
jgi:hypothetical protein